MKRILIACVLLTMLVSGCSDRIDADKTEETKKPENTTQALDTKEPVTTKQPEENNETEGTQDPMATASPENTYAPDVEPDEEYSENTNADKYEYVQYYEVEGDSITEVDKCCSILNKRISLMSLDEVEVWIENDLICIGYNDDGLKEKIELAARRGVITLGYEDSYDVFDNDKIESIVYHQDYSDAIKCKFKLKSGYASEFMEYTKEHLGDELMLECDGEALMYITVNSQVDNGEFTVGNIPDRTIFELLPIYVLSGTITQLNPATI